MTEEMLQKAMALFDTPEKWNAFVELSHERDFIRNRWFKKLQQKLVSLSFADDEHPEWICSIWNDWDIEWRLKSFDNKYLSFHTWAGFNCRLWIRNVDDGTREKVYAYLESDVRFSQMCSFYELVNINKKPSEVPWDAHFIFNFSKDFNNRSWDAMVRSFAWHAGNDTDNVARQIMEQVDKIRTPEMTDLFRKVDELLNKENS